jgi:lysozyme
MILRGLDVSYAQPGFNWTQAVREGMAFGICKRSEGTAGIDPQFDFHWNAMKEAGLIRGAYSFSRWDLDLSPADEAHWFLAHLPPLEPYDFVALDLEVSPAGVPGRPLSSWALSWLAVVEHELGVRPLLYSGAYFASQFLTDPRLAPYGKWVAAYGPTVPHLAPPWDMIALWQHTSTCACAGMTVDENYFYGTLDQLRAYGKPAPIPAPIAAVTPVSPQHQEQPRGSGTGARFLITRRMMARTGPRRTDVRVPVQWVNKGAVLNGTGRHSKGWVEVVAGGHPTWILLANTTSV